MRSSLLTIGWLVTMGYVVAMNAQEPPAQAANSDYIRATVVGTLYRGKGSNGIEYRGFFVESRSERWASKRPPNKVNRVWILTGDRSAGTDRLISLVGKRVIVSGHLEQLAENATATPPSLAMFMRVTNPNDIQEAPRGSPSGRVYPFYWFAPINDPNKPDWEILPQEAKAGEVILSKRNELGILSNFAATPFEMDGKRYASVEGFWQMMLYPEGKGDERTKDKRGTWKFTREQVAQMTAFEAKSAGTLAEENMKTLGIDWASYNGKRFPYRSVTPGEHYKLIVAAMRAKLEQNPEVKRILLATGDLILKPDHIQETNAPREWKYNEIWTQIRSEIRK